jgi:hypothetical protein
MRVIFGHQDFAGTACPGTQVMARLALITFDKGEEPDMPDQEVRDRLNLAGTMRKAAAYIERGEPWPPELLEDVNAVARLASFGAPR